MIHRFKTFFRRFKLLKFFFRKSRGFKNAIKDFVYESYYRIRGEKLIFSYFARVNNFGDLFNYDLIDFFGYKLIFKNSPAKSQVSLLGSILQMYNREFDGFVLGSGFIHERFNRLKNNWKIRLIRGPLSLSQCVTEQVNVTFGDPGILASLVYGERVNKKYKLGIVPHVSDYESVKDRFGEGVKIIKAKDHPSIVAREIQECHFIASSSLHGLIFADSFQIPNIHLKFGDKLIGGHHKFRDYYLGMGVTEYDYIEYSEGLNIETILNKCALRFSEEVLSKKQQEIVNIYKNTLNEIT